MSRRAEGGTATAPKPLRGAARLPAIPCCCPTSGGIGCPFSLGESKYEQAAPLLFHLLCGFTGYLSCFVIHRFVWRVVGPGFLTPGGGCVQAPMYVEPAVLRGPHC